jgi:hypothetical protein
LFTNSGRDCCSDFQAEASSVLDAAAIHVLPDIADILSELIDKVSEESADEPSDIRFSDIPIGSMNLDTITSCTKDKVFGGLSVKADVLFDLIYSQWSRSISAFGVSFVI